MSIGNGMAQPQDIVLPPIALEPARETVSPEVRDGLALLASQGSRAGNAAPRRRYPA